MTLRAKDDRLADLSNKATVSVQWLVMRRRPDSDAHPKTTRRRWAAPPRETGSAPTGSPPAGPAPTGSAKPGSAPAGAAESWSTPAACTGSPPAVSAGSPPAVSAGSTPAVSAGSPPAAPTRSTPVCQLRMLDHTGSCRWQRSGVSHTGQSDRRKAERASDCPHADDFLQTHGDSSLPPFQPTPSTAS
jgi:hypothetical protein